MCLHIQKVPYSAGINHFISSIGKRLITGTFKNKSIRSQMEETL